MSEGTTGPLAGIKVLEIQGLGPGPFAGMMLSDFGADVVRVDRVENVTADQAGERPVDVLGRGRKSVGVNLKSAEGVELVLRMVEQADVLIEGFRPGVMERLGLGPDICMERNRELVYGRVTGYGQDGPWAPYAGHDINYIALSGALWSIGRDGEAPVPPLTYVGDFGGGGMFLALGVCAALTERATSGRGQVVDAAMVDGSAMLNAFMYGMRAAGMWTEQRGKNLLDTGTPYYETYETSDGRWISVGAMEPKFFANLLATLGLEFDPRDQADEAKWAALRAELAATFKTRTRDEWAKLLESAEACVAPVLSPWEAPEHPHHIARNAFTTNDGVVQPSPAPRFGRTPARIAGPPPRPGEHTDAVLEGWGIDPADVRRLRDAGDVA